MAKKKAAKTPKDLLGFLLKAAENHGRESDPDMEIGDLQILVRLCWGCLTKSQRNAIAAVALDKGGLSDWMKPRKVKIGNLTIESY